MEEAAVVQVPGDKSEPAVIVLQSWTRGTLARMRCIKLAQDLYQKVYDEELGTYYYTNTMTFTTSWAKPTLLRSGDALDDLDREEAQLANLSQHERLKEEYKIDRKRKQRAEGLKQKAKKRVNLKSGKPTFSGVPEPPANCSAVSSDRAAAVWWHAAADNGNLVTAYIVRHWRLDDKTWKCKGEDKVDGLDEFDRVKTSHSVTGISNSKKYKFSVVAVNGMGKSPESKPLPEAWTAHYDKKQDRMYYHNSIMNRTLWTRPEKDIYFCDNDSYIDFNETEFKELKGFFDELDSDHVGYITKLEVQDALEKIGEVLTKKRFKDLVDRAECRGVTKFIFSHFIKVMSVVKADVEKGRGVLSSVKHKIHERQRVKVGKDMELLEEVDESKKMGPWVRRKDPTVGRSYYYNRESNEASWTMPSTCKFYLPPTLKRIMEKEFSASEIEDIKRQFNQFDLDDSGDINQTEMRMVVEALGGVVNKEDMVKLFDEMDMDGSGQVTFDEFCLMIHTIERKNKKSFLTGVRTAAHGKNDRFFTDVGHQHQVNAEFSRQSPNKSSSPKKSKKHGEKKFWDGRTLEGKRKTEDGVSYVYQNGSWIRAPSRLCIIS